MPQLSYLEDDHSTVMASSKEVQGGVGGQHPETVMLTAEGVEADPLGHVPYPDGFVLRVGEDQLLSWMKHDAGHIVVVATAGIHLPGLQKQFIFVSLPPIHHKDQHR